MSTGVTRLRAAARKPGRVRPLLRISTKNDRLGTRDGSLKHPPQQSHHGGRCNQHYDDDAQAGCVG